MQQRFLTQQQELNKMSSIEKFDAVNKIYRAGAQHTNIDRKNPGVRAIYEKICEYNPENKLKLDTVKVSRKQIKNFLRLRYSATFSEQIIKAFKFEQTLTLDEYCKTIDKFCTLPATEKCKLGFLKHDMNQDGRICANDIFNFMSSIKEHDYFSMFDYIVLSNELQKKRPNSVKEKGYLLKELNIQFMKDWEKKQ